MNWKFLKPKQLNIAIIAIFFPQCSQLPNTVLTFIFLEILRELDTERFMVDQRGYDLDLVFSKIHNFCFILQLYDFAFMACVALKFKLIQYWMLPSIGIKHSPKLFGLLKVGKHFRMLPCPALHPLKALWDWWRIGCFVVKVGWIRSCLLYDSLFNLSFLYFFAFTFSLIFSLKLNTWVLFGKRE